MKPGDFADGYPGQCVKVLMREGESGWAFIPDDLPPDLHMDDDLASATERATWALGNLNGSGRWLPNPALLIQPFMRREALASSRIEGTRAEFDQLVLLEAIDEEEIQDLDIQEVANYLKALRSGWNKPKDRPTSVGFMMELHQELLSGVRGSTKNPGELRSMQVMIGRRGDNVASARFVPPPADQVRGLLESLCAYIEAPSTLPALIRLALIHYQFETIHPFEDGNGRLGRLLMPLILGNWGLLDLPLLYLSEFFEDHRDEYVDALFAVSQRGAWKEWILFTLRAVERQSADAMYRGRHILESRERLRQRYQAGRSTSILQIVDMLFERPAITVGQAAERTAITYAAANKAIQTLVKDGVIEEATGNRRNRVFIAPQVMAAMTMRVIDENT